MTGFSSRGASFVSSGRSPACSTCIRILCHIDAEQELCYPYVPELPTEVFLLQSKVIIVHFFSDVFKQIVLYVLLCHGRRL